MAVRQGAFDDEGLIGCDQALAPQDPAQGLDLVRRPVGEVGQRRLADHFALAPALAQQDGGARPAVADGLDVHGNDATTTPA
jgi:hypothetical protein